MCERERVCVNQVKRQITHTHTLANFVVFQPSAKDRKSHSEMMKVSHTLTKKANGRDKKTAKHSI